MDRRVFTFSFILFMSSWFAQPAIANGSTDFVVKMAETKSAQSLTSSGNASTPLPSQLIIPKLHIKAFIKGMGLTNQGEMSVPDNGHDVAWFKLGARPEKKEMRSLQDMLMIKKDPLSSIISTSSQKEMKFL
ncbi:hypothetical protein MUB16_14085 [Priestia sp. OVL9]|nr:hypothetical protein [Priestia sp. OVL9]